MTASNLCIIGAFTTCWSEFRLRLPPNLYHRGVYLPKVSGLRLWLPPNLYHRCFHNLLVWVQVVAAPQPVSSVLAQPGGVAKGCGCLPTCVIGACTTKRCGLTLWLPPNLPCSCLYNQEVWRRLWPNHNPPLQPAPTLGVLTTYPQPPLWPPVSFLQNKKRPYSGHSFASKNYYNASDVRCT